MSFIIFATSQKESRVNILKLQWDQVLSQGPEDVEDHKEINTQVFTFNMIRRRK